MYPLGDFPYKQLSGPFLEQGPDGQFFSNIIIGRKTSPEAEQQIMVVI